MAVAEPLRVLVAHNQYDSRLPSGENRVVEDDIAVLRTAGVDVQSYLRSSDEIAGLPLRQKVLLPLRVTWSAEATRDVRRLIGHHRPHVLHLHNPYPLLSPAVVRVAASAGVPVVQTVHNYRLRCMAGTLFRDGAPCTQCLGAAGPLPGALHGCYRGSRSQSVAMAGSLALHRGTWRQVSRFLSLTPFMTRALVGMGVPGDLITERPTAVPDPGSSTPPGEGYVFAGRLDEDKGVGNLLSAWQMAGLGGGGRSLTIVGDGPLRPQIESIADTDPSICYVGSMNSAGVAAAMRKAAVVVVPSTCNEGLPRVVVEALALGRPVIASDVGGLRDSLTEAVAWLAPMNVEGLAGALRRADVEGPHARGSAGRHLYQERFSPEVSLSVLLQVYEEVRAATGRAA